MSTVIQGVPLGSHLPRWSIDYNVERTGAQVVQIFLSSPRTWDQVSSVGEEEAVLWRRWDVPVYVHSSYILNPASTNPEVRSRTRASLIQQLRGAASIGASGLVVHAGHASGGTIREACDNWASTLDGLDIPVPILIENTAGGASAPGRSLDGLSMLWDAVGHLNVGLCIDTCHAWAGGIPLEGLGAEIRSRIGRLDLMHANGSMDEAGSGRDRHSNLWLSKFSANLAVELALDHGAPIIMETPGPDPAWQLDYAVMRAALKHAVRDNR